MYHTACSGKDFLVMADSKLINEHRAWLKDAEKGKTRACILSILLFVFYTAVAIVNFNLEAVEFTGFIVFVVILFAIITSILLFNGFGAGKFWLLLTDVIVMLATFFPLMNSESVTTIEMALICICEFVPPLVGLVFTFVNFYMRRYFSFMPMYRAKKIYL